MYAFLYQTIYIIAATDLRVPRTYFVQKNYITIALLVIKSVLGPNYIIHGRVRDPLSIAYFLFLEFYLTF